MGRENEMDYDYMTCEDDFYGYYVVNLRHIVRGLV